MTKIKICGLTNLPDALVATEAGADLLGFILFPKSPRNVTPETIATIIPEVRKVNPAIKTVGVFVNERADRIMAIVAQTGLDYAQLHGDETVDWFTSLNGHCYKALRPADAQEAATQAATFAGLSKLEGLHWMIDAYDAAAYGGTGKRADWQTAANLARQYPGLLLAGGLTPGNVAQAIRVVQPWGVDVASGVEAEPGRKDHAKVRAFVRMVRKTTTD
ncbi:MAG TPA: phosphoribosylanthranilate isomerase [Caldilineaceae bacterium]|nr:phosphoribosylanthranilate isomerase [Caldilineaceae bacterium]